MGHLTKANPTGAFSKISKKSYTRLFGLLLPLGTLSPWSGALFAAPAASFDNDFLKASGLDPTLADYFQQAPRFTPGTTQITLSVNGRKIGQVQARFDREGALCFTPALLRRAGLVVPSAWEDGDAKSGASACRDYRDAYPHAAVHLKPQESAVDLLVPTDALQFDAPALDHYVTGGSAGLLNYDVFATRSTHAGGTSDYLQASSELGLNVHDWIVRSRQIVSSQNGVTQWSHVYAYAQRTFVKYRAIFQVGQIDIANSVLSGAPLFGVQVFPESALYDAYRAGPVVEGIAQTQARVEARQNGALLYSTMVPPGPFALRDVPVANQSADLEVAVIEATGAQQRFVVPAASFAGANLLGQAGYSFALGKVRNWRGSDAQAPWVVTGSRNWALNWRAGLSAGLMAATGYHAAGGGVSWRAPWQTNLSFKAVASRASREGVHGVRAISTLGTQLAYNLSISLSATWQTSGYRELVESMWIPTASNSATAALSRFKSQYTAALGWSHPALGSVSAGYSRASIFNDSATTQRLTVSWGRSFRHASVSLNAQRDMGGAPGTRGDSAIYLNVSIPLGKRSVSTYANRTGNQTRTGVSFSGMLGSDANYGVSADTNIPWRGASFNSNLNWRTRYSQLGATYGRYGAGNASYSASLRGSVVLHRRGVTLSPYAVDDTFGVISVGNLPGVRVQTPAGTVVTDTWGRAVIPRMTAYKPSNIRVVTQTLPRNVDIENGLQATQVGHGAVTFVNFNVVQVRRLLLTVRLPNGATLPKGSSIVDGAGRFVTAAGENGSVFLPDGPPDARRRAQLHAILPGGQQCSVDYPLPDRNTSPSYYEMLDATCQPSVSAAAPAPIPTPASTLPASPVS